MVLPSAGEQLPGRGDVVVHPLDERRDRLETLLAADPVHEVDGDRDAVQLKVVAVEHVRLDGALDPVESRIGADGDRCGPAGRVRLVETGPVTV